MFKTLNCLIGITNSGNFVIVKFWNLVDLKDNYVSNLKNANARRFPKSYALK